MKAQAIIIGAGISGLTSALWLDRKGIHSMVLEKSPRIGGCIHTEIENNFIMDFGPSSILDNSPAIQDFIQSINLDKDVIYASPSAKKRYILKNNDLHILPKSPTQLLKSHLFSWPAKLRFLGEPFISRSSYTFQEPSIAQFIRRRLGGEFLDYAIDPFIAGIFAGDAEHLSMRMVFPKLYEWERKHGSLFRGMIREKRKTSLHKGPKQLFSFKNGMQVLPNAIQENLKHGKVLLNAEVCEMQKLHNEYKVTYIENGQYHEVYSDAVLFTIPVHELKMLNLENIEFHQEVNYPPLMVIFLGYRNQDISCALDGYGFLIPRKENKKFLGCTWNSVVYPNRAPADHVAFTLYVGGSRSANMLNNPEKALGEAIQDFQDVMKIKAQPVFVKEKLWKRSIPQYNIGHSDYLDYLDQLEMNQHGLFFSGNYRKGLSLSDCINNTEAVSAKIEHHIQNIFTP